MDTPSFESTPSKPNNAALVGPNICTVNVLDVQAQPKRYRPEGSEDIALEDGFVRCRYLGRMAVPDVVCGVTTSIDAESGTYTALDGGECLLRIDATSYTF